ncbi:MAG: aldehyde dehydrogenase family protein [Bdellovibrio sp.]|nr:aldehyde dehydrogenase family protein [Bdellovibrio sp.]
MQIHSFINNTSTSLETQFTKKNPYTSEVLHTVDSAGMLEVVMSIQAAQKAFADWKTSSLENRLQLLQSFHNHLAMSKDSFARFEALDQGLPFEFVRDNGMGSLITSLDKVMRELSGHRPQANQTFTPVGVVSIICTWNLSLRVIGERLFPAIAAGNAVIIKVSSQSPVTAMIMAELIQLSQAPAGLIQVITSDQEDVKKLLVTHPGIKAISFVGQLTNATEILKLTSANSLQRFKKLQISSGSKNSAVALSEPTDEIFKKVISSFVTGQGQLGWNSSRLFILEKNEAAWKEKIADYFMNVKPSESIDDSSLWTPCLKEESFKTFSEISALAVSDQARLIQTSKPANKNFLPMTFTQDMSNCSTLQQDQVMAPLFILSTVKYAFDVAKYSNVSYFGMAAHLYGDEDKLAKVADSLDVGLICKNKWSVQLPGSVKATKQSGFGLQDDRVFGDFFSNVKLLT